MPSHPSLAVVTAYLFGASSLVGGAVTLAQPGRTYDFLGLAPRLRVAPTTTLARGLGLAAVATGAYYVLAAWQNNRSFFYLSTPVRLLTAGAFWLDGSRPLRGLAVWQGVGALVTALGLLFDHGKQERARAQRRRDKDGGSAAGGGQDADDVRETEGSEAESRKRRTVGRRFGARRSGRRE